MNYKNAIRLSKDKIYLKLHVIPGSSQSIFPAGYNQWRNLIEIKVKAEAKENQANKEIINKIAEYFNIPTKNITITSGEKSREKTIAINHLKIDKIWKKIQETLDGL